MMNRRTVSGHGLQQALGLTMLPEEPVGPFFLVTPLIRRPQAPSWEVGRVPTTMPHPFLATRGPSWYHMGSTHPVLPQRSSHGQPAFPTLPASQQASATGLRLQGEGLSSICHSRRPPPPSKLHPESPAGSQRSCSASPVVLTGTSPTVSSALSLVLS